jgi:hypothetical protein
LENDNGSENASFNFVIPKDESVIEVKGAVVE